MMQAPLINWMQTFQTEEHLLQAALWAITLTIAVISAKLSKAAGQLKKLKLQAAPTTTTVTTTTETTTTKVTTETSVRPISKEEAVSTPVDLAVNTALPLSPPPLAPPLSPPDDLTVKEEEEKPKAIEIDDDDAEPPVGIDQVIERKRKLGQPITLFGETDMQRYKRSRNIEKETHEVLACSPDAHLGPLAGKIGLQNLRNTCFMNAGLQCICHLQPLAKYFLTAGFQDDLSVACMGSKDKNKGTLARSFATVLRALWQSRSRPQRGSGSATRMYVPTDFRDVCEEQQELSPALLPKLFAVPQEQQDVQEFIGFCLAGLHEDLNRVVSQPAPLTDAQRQEEEILANEKGEDFVAALSWHRHLEREKSFIVDLFQGQLRSSVTCKLCGHTSRKFDPFMTLSVPVEQSMSDMTDAIEKFLEAEELKGDGKVYCEKCKAKVEARKKLDLWSLPPVLVLHLKRFDSNFKKMEKKLDLKVTSLDLSGFCAKTQKDGATYNVTAVANHHGGYASGHCTAVCRIGSPSSGTWHLFDDAKVTDLEDSRSVVTQQTYVVFLERCPEPRTLWATSPRDPRGPLPMLTPLGSQRIAQPTTTAGGKRAGAGRKPGLGHARRTKAQMAEPARKKRKLAPGSILQSERERENKRATKESVALPSGAPPRAAAESSAAKEQNRTDLVELREQKVEGSARPHGQRYEGAFINGRAHGHGIFSAANGNTYEGQWDQDRIHGYGKYIHVDGSTYEGEWFQDEKSGRGIENWTDGTRYEGEFLYGSKHGVGIYKSGTGEVYEGQFRHDKMDGEGSCTFADGRRYVGQWQRGKMNGMGKMTQKAENATAEAAKDAKMAAVNKVVSMLESLQQQAQSEGGRSVASVSVKKYMRYLSEPKSPAEVKKMVKDFVRQMVKGRDMSVLRADGALHPVLCRLTRELDALKIKAGDQTRKVQLAEIERIVHGAEELSDLETPLDECCATLELTNDGECISFKFPERKASELFTLCLQLFIDGQK